MAKITKKWGVVIGCWVVTLALVITGITLGLTVPSSAADEATAIKVSFAGQDTYYDNLKTAFAYVNTLTTTDDNRAVVQLQSDLLWQREKIYHDHGWGSDGEIFTVAPNNFVTWDLNGHLLTVTANDDGDLVGGGIIVEGTLTIIDSRPTVEHVLANGQTVYGGTLYGVEAEYLPANVKDPEDNIFSFYNYYYPVDPDDEESEVKSGRLVINGGNYCGQGSLITVGSTTMNSGKIMWDVKNNDMSSVMALPDTPECSFTLNGGEIVGDIMTAVGSEIVMPETPLIQVNGGRIDGEILVVDSDTENNDPVTDPAIIDQCVALGAYVKKDTDSTTGKTVYRVKTAEEIAAENLPPLTPPDENPAGDTNLDSNPTDTGNNMLGLMILGGAAAVMVIGVVTIIVVNVKRGKRKAA